MFILKLPHTTKKIKHFRVVHVFMHIDMKSGLGLILSQTIEYRTNDVRTDRSALKLMETD